MEGWRNRFSEAYTGKLSGGRGLAVPKRIISPVIRVMAGGEGLNVPETNSAPPVRGEGGALLSGFVAVACQQRSVLNLGEPGGSRSARSGYASPTERRQANG